MPSAALLREALAAYVHSTTDRSRLDEFLRSRGLDDATRADVSGRLAALVRDLEREMSRLDEAFTDARAADLLDRLRARHSWLDDDALVRVRGFANWYAWHEGLLPR